MWAIAIGHESPQKDRSIYSSQLFSFVNTMRGTESLFALQNTGRIISGKNTVSENNNHQST